MIGTCRCYDGFTASNGYGAMGTRNDCGYRDLSYNLYNNSMINTTCPVINEQICSNHGTCNKQYGLCSCDSGYG